MKFIITNEFGQHQKRKFTLTHAQPLKVSFQSLDKAEFWHN